MEKAKLWPYVDRIVQVRLKDGAFHVGMLDYVPEVQTRFKTIPERFRVGSVYFTADLVDFVCICIGGT